MSKLTELKDQIVKSREDLKVAFEDVNEDGKYSAEGKEKIKGLNTELAGLVEDIKRELAILLEKDGLRSIADAVGIDTS